MGRSDQPKTWSAVIASGETITRLDHIVRNADGYAYSAEDSSGDSQGNHIGVAIGFSEQKNALEGDGTKEVTYSPYSRIEGVAITGATRTKCGEPVYVNGATGAQAYTMTETGAVHVGYLHEFRSDTDCDFNSIDVYPRSAGDSLTITDTTDSTSVTTGALIVNGGIGCAKSMFIGGTLNVTSIDSEAAETLTIGPATATKVEIADTLVTTEIQGPLTVLAATGNGIDVSAAGGLYLGETTATTISVGTGAQAKTITIGNVTGATAVNVNSGTAACAWTTTNGAFSLITGTGAINLGADAAAKTITIGNVTGATAVNVNSGTAACAWTTTNGAFSLITGTGAIAIGTDATAKTITIGNAASTSLTLEAGLGACLIDADGDIDLQTSAGGINIATDAVAVITTIGNVTGVSQVIINSGTAGDTWTTTNGDWTLATGTGAIDIGTDAAAKTITIGNVTGATAVNVNSGTAACAWTTTNGAFSLITGTGAIAIGTDATAKTITIGNAASTSLTLEAGVGACLIDADGDIDLQTSAGGINIATDAVAVITTIGNITGASQVVINSGTAGDTWTTTNGTWTLATGTGNIGIGTDAAAKTITIGNITTTTAVNVNSGSGACAWTTTNGAFSLITGTGAIAIGTDATAKTIAIGNAASTSLTLEAGVGACLIDADGDIDLQTSAGGINIATDAVAVITTIGNVTGASQVVINSGTAGIQLASTGAGDITIDSDDTLLIDSDGVLELNSSAGDISIANDAVALNVNVATGGAAMTLIIGSTNTTSTTTINAGSGDINLGGDTYSGNNITCQGLLNAADAGGAADVYTATLDPATNGAYVAGEWYILYSFPNPSTGGAVTLNIDARGAAGVVTSTGAAPAANDISATHVGIFFYNGANFVLLNPATTCD